MYDKRASSIFTLSLALFARSCPTCAFSLHPPRSRKFVESQGKTSVAVGMGSHDNELDNDETWLASHSVYSSKNNSEGNIELQ